MRVITAFGPSDCFTAGDGIDQGEVISPLIWRIFYDPLLTRVQHDTSLGYNIEVNWPAETPPHVITKSLRIACTAFADDTAWIASNKHEMEQILDISNEFYVLNDIKINGEKSEIIVINAKTKDKEQELTLNLGSDHTLVHANPSNLASRYLGIYIKGMKGTSHVTKLLQNEVNECVAALKYKRTTLAQLVYVNNCVLLPRLVYRAKTTYIPDTKCHTIHNPFLRLIKRKMKCPSTSNTNIITHCGFVGAKSLFQNLYTSQSTDFIMRINDTLWSGESTRLRLMFTQLQLGLNECILTINPRSILKFSRNFNLAFNILKSLKDQCYEFTTSSKFTTWNIPTNGTPILDLLSSPQDELPLTSASCNTEDFRSLQLKAISSYQSRKGHLLSLIHVNQLLYNKGDSLLTWSQLKCILNLNLQGKRPTFYLFLQFLLTDDIDSYRVTKHPIHNHNTSIFPRITLSPPSADNRKKEWIWIKQEANSHSIGKIINKSPSMRITYQHWQFTSQDLLHAVPCGGCDDSVTPKVSQTNTSNLNIPTNVFVLPMVNSPARYQSKNTMAPRLVYRYLHL